VIVRRLRLQLGDVAGDESERRDRVISVVVDELLKRPPAT
jgi:hypothetical protein